MAQPAVRQDVTQLDRLERALAGITRSLAARHALHDLASRSGHQLPPASWSLLEYLDDLGPMRVSAIAECHGVDISSVTPRLQTLQRAGLVERNVLPSDGRVSMIEITDSGRAALGAVHAARREVIAEAITQAHLDQLGAVVEPLERLADILVATRETSTD
jgi:DNA-binding MarR family transcriptional regulator